MDLGTMWLAALYGRSGTESTEGIAGAGSPGITGSASAGRTRRTQRAQTARTGQSAEKTRDTADTSDKPVEEMTKDEYGRHIMKETAQLLADSLSRSAFGSGNFLSDAALLTKIKDNPEFGYYLLNAAAGDSSRAGLAAALGAAYGLGGTGGAGNASDRQTGRRTGAGSEAARGTGGQRPLRTMEERMASQDRARQLQQEIASAQRAAADRQTENGKRLQQYAADRMRQAGKDRKTRTMSSFTRQI